MRKNKKCILLFSALLYFTCANAQIDFAHLITKGSADFPSSYGGGAFLEFALHVNHGDQLIIRTR